MQLATIDWVIIGAFFAVTLGIGLLFTRRAGSNTSEFFLSGRTMPWWLLGFSMVATTFAADTPLLVTGLVREKGVAGNWEWWAFLLTGTLTVFVYAKLWRRSEITTDVEFYELRYSGPAASFLRGFRALYLGIFFNVIIMAIVTVAGIKIGHTMFGFSPAQTILSSVVVTVIFSALGGLTAVIWVDALLFIIAMIGSFGAAYYALDHVGGFSQLLSHPNVADKLALFPSVDMATPDKRNLAITLLIYPLAVQWWASWYPGAEPGGGGYIAQRMLSAKNEKHATGATLFFNAAHYALRPWPWIIVALASLIVFPDLDSLRAQFPDLPEGKVKEDLGYPAMLTFLPAGMTGVVVASLIAAYISTIATHLNWGSSYIVNDYWKRFYRPEADEKELVRVGRISTAVLMVLAAALALVLEDAVQGFEILLQIGAGTGLIFILRWFWWRINPYSEITAMVVSFVIALISFAQNRFAEFLKRYDLTWKFQDNMVDSGWNEGIAAIVVVVWPHWMHLAAGVFITTCAWMVATLLTRPDDDEKLRSFCRLVRPGGWGWKKVYDKAAAEGVIVEGAGSASGVPLGIVCMILGCAGIYSALFSTGYFLYGDTMKGAILAAVAVVSAIAIFALWNKVHET